MLKEINILADFAGVDVGQIVTLGGKKALFIGNRLVKTCGCCVPNCFEFPHVVRAKTESISGEIELIEIRLLEKPRPKKITGMSIIHTIDKNHKEYVTFRNLLLAAEMMPE